MSPGRPAARPALAGPARAAALGLLLACGACLHRPGAARPPGAAPAPVELQLLAFSDFHGRLTASDRRGAPPGAVALAAALEAAALPGRSLVVEAGDLFGASEPESGLLGEAPTVAAFGCLCRGEPCLAVGALGNHELDRGWPALRRLLAPDPAPPAPAFQSPWPGAAFPLLAANLRDRRTGQGALPGSVIREVAGVRVGLVGAATADLPQVLRPAALEGLEVEDSAVAVNREVARLREAGATVVVVLLHEGDEVPGRLAAIVARLDPAVDVVVSGHSHQRDERRLPTAAPGREALVIQSGPHGRAFHDVRLTVDPATGRARSARTRLVPVAAPPAGVPRGEATRCVAEVVARAEALAGPRLAAVVGHLPDPPPLTAPLVAEAYRVAMGADLGLVNHGGVRADLPAGPVTWRHLHLAQPFGNVLCTVPMDGAAIAALLERSRRGDGLGGEWAGLEGPPGAPRVGGETLRPERRYTVATIDYLLDQGRVPGLDAAKARCDGPLDVEAVAALVAAQGELRPAAAP